MRKPSITTRPHPGNGRAHPPLWDVLADGVPIDGARVLKMGRRYLPIYDPSPPTLFASGAKRSEAAQHAYECHLAYRRRTLPTRRAAVLDKATATGKPALVLFTGENVAPIARAFTTTLAADVHAETLRRSGTEDVTVYHRRADGTYAEVTA